MQDIKTISMDSSKLGWEDIEQDAKQAGFQYVSSYVQYCLEFFHNKNNRRIFSRITPIEFYVTTILTLLIVLVGLLVFR